MANPPVAYGKILRKLKRELKIMDKALYVRGVAIDNESAGGVALDKMFARLSKRRKILNQDYEDLAKLRTALHSMARIREGMHELLELLEDKDA
jgi:hypothetical protein